MLRMTTMDILRNAKTAAPSLAAADTQTKNNALLAMADALVDATVEILKANEQDMEAAKGHISEVMLDRLCLTQSRIAGTVCRTNHSFTAGCQNHTDVPVLQQS